MQHRAEDFAIERGDPIEFDDGGRDIGPVGRQTAVPIPAKFHAIRTLLLGKPIVQVRLGLRIDHRADMRADAPWVANFQFARGACQHVEHWLGDILLQAE